MITPFVDTGLGNSSYGVDLGDGRALVVDPVRDVRSYRRWGEKRRLRLAYSLETHLHADFVTGSLELARIQAQVLAPSGGHAEFPHRPLESGEEVDLSGLTLRAIGTPGHTPEHLAYLLLDGSRPIALFSGGALIVGGVARTDLIDPDHTEALARSLFRALRDRIRPLPDDLPVYPTHGAGSFCSAPGTAERTTTIGRERASNPLLTAADEDTFLRLLTDGLGTFPRYFLALREVNRRGPRAYGEHRPTLAPLTPGQVKDAVRNGAELIDGRPIASFAGGHIPGAVSIALRPAFASWLGWVVEPDRDLVFVLDPGQDRDDLVEQCLKIGFEQLIGELDGGMESWRAAGLPEQRIELSTTPPMDAPILDVRQASEFQAGHVPNAVHIELGSIGERGRDVAASDPVVMCGHGERAMTAASLLERDGSRPAVFAGSPSELAEHRGTGLTGAH
ncbi:MAG: MBL fold metallo-hydrolase [Candidatus Limnocylindria bacterium]